MKRRFVIAIGSIALSGCVTLGALKFDELYGPAQVRDRTIEAVLPNQINYWQSVKPILDNRCVVCHGCYDAPCQLKLTAIEGIDRGASSAAIYNQSRRNPAPLTRLFEDAHSTQEWREQGFFPVLNEHADTEEANRQASIMYRLLDLKELHPLPGEDVLGEQFTIGNKRKQVCPGPENIGKFEKKHPLWGMPYALPGLNDGEQLILKRWLEQGATHTARSLLDEKLINRIAYWETFLNLDSLKGQLVNRYIYEHLFIANIYFDDVPGRVFFKLVRSATPPGQPVERITSRRPYDDPGVGRVYYRLVPELESIVVKTHLPYLLNDARMQRWQSLFYDTPYQVTSIPGYAVEQAANPFDSFQEIPVSSRYKFMLDEAQFSIMNFIKGPVCRGQAALNVIKDHFWVFFVTPESGKEDVISEFLYSHKIDLELPSAKGDINAPVRIWKKYSKKERRLLAARDQLLVENYSAPEELGLSLLWDGNGNNQNAALTVFRHFDSATVEKGLIGAPPQTAWVIDYSLLERIHYLLVAGYDVYGNVGHQLISRIYMDFLRMEGEANFLLLLPVESRRAEREHWYRNANPALLDFLSNPSYENLVEPSITYTTSDHKLELYQMIGKRLAAVLPQRHALDSLRDGALEEPLRRLGLFTGSGITLLGDTSIIEIIDEQSGDSEYVTLIRNNAHLSITSMFGENKLLAPDENTVTVARGFIGAYPNAFFKLNKSDLSEFVERVLALQDTVDYTSLLDDFGVRRTDSSFWSHSDRIHQAMKEELPLEFGMLDYNRLENR